MKTMIKLFYNLMFPITTYAEIHYRLFPGFPSLLFRSVPEIIADVPHRVTGDKLPIFLLIKDAHHFPVTINSLRIIQKNKTIFEKQLNITIKEKWDWHLIEFDNPFMNNEVNQFFVEINFTTLNNNKQHKVINDSFPHFLLLPHFLLRKKKPFIVFTSDNELPGKSLCWWGDIHTHSEFTEDQVEFGSPLPFLHKAAKIIGLDFAVITDHSYDLDDEPDNYLKNSSGAPKFAKMCKAVNELSNAPIFIAGEEVSWGNCKNENIHAVIINPQMLYKGYGDSGERYFLNSPTHKLNEEIKKKSTEEIIFAAHPFKKIKKSQKFFLKRGKWNNEDLLNKNIDGWQILN
ncbi:MAG: hypothetical protein KAR38_14260, partial [Calditrichia bacterium]|nr:hypothetical protein [Calditrichia bacterium]